ncbi:glycosyltransferase family 4 protein [Alicyclobacillus sp.]|uniref:glycosyltransferase family 4 protein n=1 Tax=Alicyclobacillus sp. TaxID=61169 RepID=UPI0025BCADB4|nr:glycosyltransferase family 4 protein [Alicyclobacillus sp.]MCL6517286.1 glycosyltransferase family 4 protein [Alicyclobacillus sp.]
MRIWVFTFEYGPTIIGGLGVVATRLSQALAELGHQVTVFTRAAGPPGMTQDAGISVVHVPTRAPYYHIRRRRYQVDPLVRLADQLHLHPPDVIHVHSVPFTNVALHLGQRFGAPVVYTCHSLVRDEPQGPVQSRVQHRQERLLHRCHHVIVPSEWQLRSLVEAYPACRERVSVIANGVDLPEGARLATLATLAAERSGSQGLRLLFAGRLVPEKGIDSLIRAVTVLRRRGFPVVLDVVGSGPSAYERHLRQLARRLRVAQHIRWLGFHAPSEMPRVYLSHDLVVMPSRQESFGLVALEAMAHGVPLVSTRAGGLADFVDRQVAEIIPRTTGLAVASAVQRLVSRPRHLVSRVEAARHRAERFCWKNVAERHVHLFESLHQRMMDTTSAP